MGPISSFANELEAAKPSVHKMLNPSSVAIVGATSRLQYGGRFLQSCLRSSANLRVYPVNPRYDELLGVRCYPSISDLPESPDLVGIVVPYRQVLPVIQECADKGAGAAIVISAGFAERGEEDRAELQLEIGRFARTSGVRICGPNCLGIANLKDDIWASSSSLRSGTIGPGPIGLVSQSGASAFGPLLARAIDRSMGFTYIVSTGNEVDLDASDFIYYLLDDADTRVIGCFVEGLKDGRKFLEVARFALERGKPIVVAKIGRSESGAMAARSHTASLTGSDALHDAAFKQYGVTRVEDFDELLEVCQLMAYSGVPPARGVSVVSHSGGISSITADKCGQEGLYLPPITEECRQGVNDVLQGFGWAANPADVTGFAMGDSFPRILELMSTGPEVGVVAVASAGGDAQARQIIDLRDKSGCAVAFLWTGSMSATEGLPKLREGHIPVFSLPGRLARGISALVDYHLRARSKSVGSNTDLKAISEEQRQGLELTRSLGRRSLTEREAKELLSLWGITAAREGSAQTPEEAVHAAQQLGYPVVLKVESADILHKSDVGGVKVGLRDEEELRRAFDEAMASVRRSHPEAQIQGASIQEMITGGVEMIVGLSHDVQFGPTILLGMGGTLVEVYKDVAMRVCPISRDDALEMVDEVKGAIVLRGYRGNPPADVDALVEVLLKMSDFALSVGQWVEEVDINPLAVLPRGQGARALDALVIMGEPAPGHPSGG